MPQLPHGIQCIFNVSNNVLKSTKQGDKKIQLENSNIFMDFFFKKIEEFDQAKICTFTFRMDQ